jgi:hypothetical protein
MPSYEQIRKREFEIEEIKAHEKEKVKLLSEEILSRKRGVWLFPAQKMNVQYSLCCYLP